MIITKTPFRISFFGGGTDYPAWYREHGGTVLAAAIDKFAYISCRHLPPFFEHKHRIVYSRVETPTRISDIQHPVVRAVLQEFNDNRGLEIHYDGDLPARSGVGANSSFTVGLIQALAALRGRLISKSDLAKQAIRIQQEVLKESVGSQDQLTAAYGGLNWIKFRPDDTFLVDPIVISKERKKELAEHLMLIYCREFTDLTEHSRTEPTYLKTRASELKGLQDLVNEAADVLQSQSTPISRFGQLLHESWCLKKQLSPMHSSSKIENLYQAGMESGAIGGKVLGSGGGGFLLLFAKKVDQERIKEKFKNLLLVPFEFDEEGSRIAVYDPGSFVKGAEEGRQWAGPEYP